jgi:transposase
MARPTDRPRVVTANRTQLELRSFDLDATLPADHRARSVWAIVERLDLSAYYDAIQSRGATAGRPATDPKILLALWLYATIEGVGSGRQLERLCSSDDAYRWICGGVAVNYHTLTDFRVGHEDALDGLLTQILAALMHQGLVTLDAIAHDGMRVRADAGAASFRRDETLVELQREVQERVAALRRELAADPAAAVRIRQAARDRAARERADRIDRALGEIPAIAATKRRNRKRRDKKQTVPRASTTDPEARVMKMPDGGYRPAFNVHLATDVASRVIVGALLTNRGTDYGMITPMIDEVRRRTAVTPGVDLVDGGFVSFDDMLAAEQRGVTVYAPPPPARGGVRRDPEPPHVLRWRSRMGRHDARVLYKRRASTAETTNADLRRWRSLDRFPVRGLRRSKCHVLLNVLAHNLMRWRELEAA